jgi:hypothetical protein
VRVLERKGKEREKMGGVEIMAGMAFSSYTPILEF